jgi:ABC-type transport system substrate-binding protein
MLEEKSDWTTNKLTVIKNPDYWQKDAAGTQLPYLDKIEFNNIKEAPQRAAAVRTGAYDAGMFSSAGEGSNILQLRRAKTKELRSGVEYYPSLWFNQGRPGSPFANADARKAVSHCIDRAAFNRVRQSGQGRVAKSLVGPSSVMYSNKGLQAFRVATARKAVADYKKATGKKNLSFTIPSDVSAASQANIKFLKSQWAKCGITAVVKTSESADIIAKAFNASPNTLRNEFFNAYDAISITLFEGTDVSFNLPFVLSSAFSQGSAAYPAYGSGLCTPAATTVAACAAELAQSTPAPTAANLAATRALVYAGLGTVLGLNHHKDKTIDDCFFTEQAKADVNTVDYGACTQKLIDGNVMTSITHFYYTMFFSKKGKLTGYGESKLPGGEARRKISNYGIDWSTVSKG